MKFKKKPVVIEAWQWDEKISTLKLLIENGMEFCSYETHKDHDWVRALRINTLEGPHHVTLNDWIIKGIKGEFYPCKPDIFEMTYEEVLLYE